MKGTFIYGSSMNIMRISSYNASTYFNENSSSTIRFCHYDTMYDNMIFNFSYPTDLTSSSQLIEATLVMCPYKRYATPVYLTPKAPTTSYNPSTVTWNTRPSTTANGGGSYAVYSVDGATLTTKMDVLLPIKYDIDNLRLGLVVESSGNSECEMYGRNSNYPPTIALIYTKQDGSVASVQIGGIYKQIDKIYTKVDDAWKSVSTIFVNVSNNWKTISAPDPIVISSNVSVHNEVYYLVTAGTSQYASYLTGRGVDYQLSSGYAFNTSLVRTALYDTNTRSNAAGGSFLDTYLIYGGGYYQYTSSPLNNVIAFNASLVRTTLPNLTVSRSSPAAAEVGNYFLIAGGNGYNGYANYAISTVDVYDSSLTRLSSISLSTGRFYLTGGKTSSHALFAGGADFGTSYNVVDAFNTSLVRTSPTALPTASSDINQRSATVSDGVVFPVGSYGVHYNNSLVRTQLPSVPEIFRPIVRAASIQDHVLFCTDEDDLVCGYLPDKTIAPMPRRGVSRAYRQSIVDGAGYVMLLGGLGTGSTGKAFKLQ